MFSAGILICCISLWDLGNQGFKTLPGSDDVYIDILFHVPPLSSVSDGCLSSQFESLLLCKLWTPAELRNARAQRTEKYMLHVLNSHPGDHCSGCWLISMPCCTATSKAVQNAPFYWGKWFIWGIGVGSAGCFWPWSTYWRSK